MKDCLWINGIDAFERWGLSLDQDALSVLMQPSDLKEYVSNSSRLIDGVQVVPIAPRVSDRTITIMMNLTAQDSIDFMAKYMAFQEAVLYKGSFSLRTKHEPNVEYKLLYQASSSFNQALLSIGKIGLKLIEPNPKDRSRFI